MYRATPGEAGSAGHPPIFVFLVLHRSLQPSLCVIHRKKTNVFRLHCPMHMLSVAFSLFVSCRSSPPLSFSLTLFLSLSFSLPLSLSLSLSLPRSFSPSLPLSSSRFCWFKCCGVAFLPVHLCVSQWTTGHGSPPSGMPTACLRGRWRSSTSMAPPWRRRGHRWCLSQASQQNKLKRNTTNKTNERRQNTNHTSTEGNLKQ